MTRVLVCGFGYVGKAYAALLKRKYDVWVYDPHIEARDILEAGYQAQLDLEDTNVFQAAFVCVPTPSLSDGGCDTSIVENVVNSLESPLIVIKSTVRPGTTARLMNDNWNIVFSPEYIGEGKYAVSPRMDFQTDVAKTPWVIAGGESGAVQDYFDLLLPILGPEKTYYACSPTEAETIKYMENCYFALKVAFANEFYDVCQALGADWYKVWQGWALDPRVDVMHTAVFPDNRGFGGKCLPKDLNALIAASHIAGFTPELLLQAAKSNAKVRPDEPVRVDL